MYTLRFPYKDISYPACIQLTELDSLKIDEKRNYLTFFLYKITYGQIQCESLLSKIMFRVPPDFNSYFI